MMSDIQVTKQDLLMVIGELEVMRRVQELRVDRLEAENAALRETAEKPPEHDAEGA